MRNGAQLVQRGESLQRVPSSARNPGGGPWTLVQGEVAVTSVVLDLLARMTSRCRVSSMIQRTKRRRESARHHARTTRLLQTYSNTSRPVQRPSTSKTPSAEQIFCEQSSFILLPPGRFFLTTPKSACSASSVLPQSGLHSNTPNRFLWSVGVELFCEVRLNVLTAERQKSRQMLQQGETR